MHVYVLVRRRFEDDRRLTDLSKTAMRDMLLLKHRIHEAWAASVRSQCSTDDIVSSIANSCGCMRSSPLKGTGIQKVGYCDVGETVGLELANHCSHVIRAADAAMARS